MDPVITMTGRVGHTPELRTTRSGVECTRFRLAHTPRIWRDGDWVDGDTCWVTVHCYRQLANNVCRSLRKGEPVVVTGRVGMEAWIDESTNTQRESITIDARSVGHDLAFGATMFQRIRPEKPGDDEQGTAASAEGQGEDAVGVDDSPSSEGTQLIVMADSHQPLEKEPAF